MSKKHPLAELFSNTTLKANLVVEKASESEEDEDDEDG